MTYLATAFLFPVDVLLLTKTIMKMASSWRFEKNPTVVRDETGLDRRFPKPNPSMPFLFANNKKYILVSNIEF